MTVLTAIDLERTYNVEEFMDLPDDGKLYELVEGKLFEMSQPGDEHGRVSDNLYSYLSRFVRQNKLGRLYLPTGFRLGGRTVRAPDVGFVTASRVPPVSRKAVAVPPDLAVEVISPTDVWSEIVDKNSQYQQAGVPLVWLLDPYSQVVFVYRLNSGLVPQVLGPEADLDGENIVPGFKLKVSNLFEYE